MGAIEEFIEGTLRAILENLPALNQRSDNYARIVKRSAVIYFRKRHRLPSGMRVQNLTVDIRV